MPTLRLPASGSGGTNTRHRRARAGTSGRRRPCRCRTCLRAQQTPPKRQQLQPPAPSLPPPEQPEQPLLEPAGLPDHLHVGASVILVDGSKERLTGTVKGIDEFMVYVAFGRWSGTTGYWRESGRGTQNVGLLQDLATALAAASGSSRSRSRAARG